MLTAVSACPASIIVRSKPCNASVEVPSHVPYLSCPTKAGLSRVPRNRSAICLATRSVTPQRHATSTSSPCGCGWRSNSASTHRSYQASPKVSRCAETYPHRTRRSRPASGNLGSSSASSPCGSAAANAFPSSHAEAASPEVSHDHALASASGATTNSAASDRKSGLPSRSHGCKPTCCRSRPLRDGFSNRA